MNPSFAAIAGAAACLVSLQTHAQSSTTLFGVLDLAVQRLTSEGIGSTSRLSSGSNQPSRLGLRGEETLGDGLKASFWLEGTIAADTGLGGPNNSNNQGTGAVGASGFQLDRRSTLSLSNPLGELRVGRDYTPTYWNTSRADPFTANGVGSVRNLVGAGAVAAVTGVRASNAVGYFLPSDLGGVYGQAMYALGENPSTAANRDDGRYLGARVGYAQGAVDMAMASGKTTYLSGDITLTNVFAAYHFGTVKVSGLWNQTALKSATPRQQRDWMLAAVVPVGSGQIDLSYTRARVTTSPAGAGASQVAVGYLHHLSKRTAPYVHYARISNRGGAQFFTNGAGAPTPGGSTSGIEVGVRHYF